MDPLRQEFLATPTIVSLKVLFITTRHQLCSCSREIDEVRQLALHPPTSQTCATSQYEKKAGGRFHSNENKISEKIASNMIQKLKKFSFIKEHKNFPSLCQGLQ